MTVADYILQTLSLNGVSTVFGLPGVHALGMWNALAESPMRYIGFRHEHAAAHAADGYGRISGLPGVVLLSTGPGELNSISALGEARVSSSPVLAISSQIPTNFLGKKKGFLHETEDILAAAGVVCGYTARATDPEQIPGILYQAIAACVKGRPGPSFIEIPMDLFDAEVHHDPVEITRTEDNPDESQLKEAALLLTLAARPVIWAGGGVIRSGASKALTMLAELLDAPVITTFMGKGAIDEDHRLAIGPMVRQPEAQDLLREADLMLAVGTRFSAMTTGNFKLTLPQQLIHMDIDQEEIGRNYPVRLGIVSDARPGLEALIQAINSRDSERRVVRAMDEVRRGWSPRARSIREACLKRARQEGSREMALLEAVRESLPSNTVMMHDMTIPSYWAAPFLRVTEPGTFHYPYGFGSLGFSFPAALGAAAATSGPVVCFSGDGGFQYHLQELATARQHRLDVKVIVFNDGAWGVLRAFSTSRYDHDFGMQIEGPNLERLSEAYGIPYSRADTPEQLAESLSSRMGAAGPALIEVQGRWRLPPPSEYYR